MHPTNTLSPRQAWETYIGARDVATLEDLHQLLETGDDDGGHPLASVPEEHLDRVVRLLLVELRNRLAEGVDVAFSAIVSDLGPPLAAPVVAVLRAVRADHPDEAREALPRLQAILAGADHGLGDADLAAWQAYAEAVRRWLDCCADLAEGPAERLRPYEVWSADDDCDPHRTILAASPRAAAETYPDVQHCRAETTLYIDSAGELGCDYSRIRVLVEDADGHQTEHTLSLEDIEARAAGEATIELGALTIREEQGTAVLSLHGRPVASIDVAGDYCGLVGPWVEAEGTMRSAVRILYDDRQDTDRPRATDWPEALRRWLGVRPRQHCEIAGEHYPLNSLDEWDRASARLAELGLPHVPILATWAPGEAAVATGSRLFPRTIRGDG
jgi:hypothetical protein